ncbi:hypothetical protein AVMA1855_09570 [Acidovorax sp. SUPP1855]|uniref:MarR family winged helix-turn-helix transcriptional regulator n=1 Tax=Acidovorax sp. SUPP1855 TaxID=431774 RepID=UPI0023DE1F51|nr:MarR family transcriptional regulator [Acidovorax sp. SUPP1855]GKS84388.1 hypothetical protein AVMA1855_09570 [Acidovorax sp. SUPP1855]
MALAHALVAAELETVLGESVGLSINEFDVLAGLDAAPGKSLPLSDLDGLVRLSQPAISRMVARLMDRELVTRSGSPNDRRRYSLHLTKTGAELLVRAVPIHSACIQRRLLARLSPNERDVLRDALLKIIDTAAPAPNTL